jgi:hypothetical protein
MTNQIFLSYRQESDTHCEDVLRLARQIQAQGIPVELDQLYFQAHSGGPPQGWPKWCEDRVTQAEKTLIVASPGWFAAYEGSAPAGTGLGAACESGLVRQMLYDVKGINERFRLVFLDAMAPEAVPIALRPWHQFMLYKGAREFDDLLRWITGHGSALVTVGATSPISTPDIGMLPISTTLPLLPRDLLEVLAENYPDVRDARALWQRAGGRAAEVENISRPFDLWQNLWRRSVQGAAAQPKALLREVQQDYPGNPVVVHYLSSL